MSSDSAKKPRARTATPRATAPRTAASAAKPRTRTKAAAPTVEANSEPIAQAIAEATATPITAPATDNAPSGSANLAAAPEHSANNITSSNTSRHTVSNEATSIFADLLSGQFDADAENDADSDADNSEPAKRVLTPQADAPKLHKVLAQAGLGSRLEMERFIAEGRITVNNQPAHVGQRIQYGDSIKINGKPVRVRITPPAPRVIAYHKPVGELVTHDDPQNRPTVFRKLPRLQQGKWLSVGRLDLNTEGLLLLTNSGELANQLMHPRFGLQREYAVRVLGALNEAEKQRLTSGIKLEDGMAQFGSIEEGGGEGANCWYRVTISEGRNREVRRMFEAVGRAVSRLIRVRYGTLHLPRSLRRGQWAELHERDTRDLMDLVGMTPIQRGEGEPATQAATLANRRRNPDRGGSAKAGGKRARTAAAPASLRPAAPASTRSTRFGGNFGGNAAGAARSARSSSARGNSTRGKK